MASTEEALLAIEIARDVIFMERRSRSAPFEGGLTTSELEGGWETNGDRRERELRVRLLSSQVSPFSLSLAFNIHSPSADRPKPLRTH